ncbi:MAG TPA: hypothetical protein VLM89_08165 [Phycisphaerae bacterium]|nr:hypothetical protein [Phycisphaerae bacterium]
MQTAFLLAIALASGGQAEPGSAEFKSQAARVQVTLTVGQYAYEVTNLGASPIMRFEIGQRHTYKPEAPHGWGARITGDAFEAWTEDPSAAILPGQSALFQMRVGSEGAVLGESVARVTFDDGRVAAIDRVWSPQSQPCSSVFIQSAGAAGIILAYALWVYRRGRKRAGGGAT